MLSRFVASVMLLSVAIPAAAHTPASVPQALGHLPAGARSAAATVDAFHEALRTGKTAAALALLADNALIYEEGRVELGKAEYARAHLAADSEFSRAVPSTRVHRTGGANGAIAWIATEARVKGSFRGSVVDRMMTETVLLRRAGSAWRIVHIHWSSAAAPSTRPAATSQALLAGSSPANGAVVSGPLDALELYFSPPARLHEVTIAGPEGRMPMMVTATGENARYSLPLAGLGAGSYMVDWRASAGSREESGTFTFTIR